MTSFSHGEYLDRREVAAMAQSFADIYARLQSQLEPQHDGEHIVINIVTGEHFIASTRSEAFAKAKDTLGSTDYCWSRRIGSD